MRYTHRKLFGGVCAAALACPISASAQAAPPPGEPDNGDVIVTAQKRSETLQTVPLSITALTEKDLERRGVQSLYDVSRIAPSLAVVSSGPGENNLIVRGISSVAGSAATVGYYLDDTPIAASSNAALLSTRGVIDPSALDIARIEVLRGPQGTLYGSSSMGGTVRYIANQPVLDRTSGRIRAELSDTEHGGVNYNVNGIINLPVLKDVAALRVAAYYRRDDGYIDRFAIDPANYLAAAPGAKRQDNVNTYETYGARASVLIQASDTLSITPSFLYQYSKLGSPFTFDGVPGSLGNPIQVRDVDEANVQRSWIANLVVKKTLGPIEVLSSSSYYHREVSLNDDASKVINYFFATPTVYPVGMHGEYRNNEFTEELRASSGFAGPFQFIVGGFYHDVKAPLESAIPIPAGFPYAGQAPFNSFATIYAGTRRATLQEYAAFGELSYKITPTLTARAGVRVFKVDQGFYQSGDGLLNGGFSEVRNSSRDSGVTPKATLQWQVTPDKLLYATVSKGYRPGGPNNPAPASLCGTEVGGLGLNQGQLSAYGPDHLWNYEIGAKTSWLDRHLSVNGSAFYIDWSKVQQQIVLQCGFNITANFGKAVSKGGELEIELRPTDQLTFGGGFGYTDATLKSDVPGTAARDGDRLQNVPKWTVNASAEYHDDIGDSLKGFARLDYSYVGPANFLYDRTSPFYRRAGFSVFNTRIGLDPVNAPWEAALFVTNIFDKRGATDLPVAISADLPTTRRIALNQPRTIGVNLGYRF